MTNGGHFRFDVEDYLPSTAPLSSRSGGLIQGVIGRGEIGGVGR